MSNSLVQRVRDIDRSRPGFTGEHWLTLAGGVAVWLATRRHPSLAVRLLGSVAGTAAVARAATGRKVPPRLTRWLPFAQERQRGPR